jgi:hypothetical protein
VHVEWRQTEIAGVKCEYLLIKVFRIILTVCLLFLSVSLPTLCKGFCLRKGTFHFCVFFFILLWSLYPFKKVYFLLVSPFLSDKDVTLICFMDIKFHPVQKLATNFYFSFHKLLKTFSSRDSIIEFSLKLCRL